MGIIPFVDAKTQAFLLSLNRQFYQTFGPAFAEKRGRLQPGVARLLPTIPDTARVLDLGCGHGMVLRALAAQGFTGLYRGVDFSPTLLDIARRHTPSGLDVRFVQADLTTPEWVNAVAEAAPYDVVLAFAVLHHLPGADLRQRLVRQIAALLRPGGRFLHAHWQFLNSPRLRKRIQPWQRLGLHPEQVDPGDYLLDWRHGGTGLRYVHHFSPEELHALAQHAGFQVMAQFLSDGEGGRLGLYQVWEKRT